jgi:hypothetical protein
MSSAIQPGKGTEVSPRCRLTGLARHLLRLPSRGLILMVRGYQYVLSPVFGGQCRFHPSCSAYFILAVEKYGALKGAYKGLARILRCHPFHPGGIDYP